MQKQNGKKLSDNGNDSLYYFHHFSFKATQISSVPETSQILTSIIQACTQDI